MADEDVRAGDGRGRHAPLRQARPLSAGRILRTAGTISLYIVTITLGLFLVAFVAYLVAS